MNFISVSRERDVTIPVFCLITLPSCINPAQWIMFIYLIDMVYNGGNVKTRMHAWVEGFAKQDLSVLISATVARVQADKEWENSGDSCVSLTLQTPSEDVLWNTVMQFLLCVWSDSASYPICHGLNLVQNCLKICWIISFISSSFFCYLLLLFVAFII